MAFFNSAVTVLQTLVIDVYKRQMLGMKVKDIAAMEGITPSQAGKSIHAALRRLRRYFARQKWTVNL